MKKVIISGLVYLVAIVMFSGCTDNAVPYDLANPDLQIDTVTVNAISGGTYYSPPIMGSVPALYFGKKDGFDNQFSLLEFYDRASSGASNYFYDLLDSTITVDSMLITLTATEDTLLTTTLFDLYYFPAGSDSIFSETESNIDNLSESDIATAVLIGSVAFTQATPDSTESIYPILNFKLEPQNEILEFLADTVDTQNLTFMLKNDNLNDEMVAITSRESFINYPELNIYFHTDSDTLSSTFRLTKDLTIVKPPEVSEECATHLSIGRAQGLKSILQFDLDNFNIDKTMIIRSAELVFNYSDETVTDDFAIQAVVLQDSVDVVSLLDGALYWNIAEDEYSVETSGIMTGTFSEGKMSMEIRQFVQGINTGSYNNYGLKVYSYIASDPFMTIHLIKKDENISETNPYLRITYVTP